MESKLHFGGLMERFRPADIATLNGVTARPFPFRARRCRVGDAVFPDAGVRGVLAFPTLSGHQRSHQTHRDPEWEEEDVGDGADDASSELAQAIRDVVQGDDW